MLMLIISNKKCSNMLNLCKYLLLSNLYDYNQFIGHQ